MNNTEEIRSLIIKAIDLNIKQSNIDNSGITVLVQDVCSMTYAVGMENCANELAKNLASVSLAAAAAALAFTPASGAALYFGGVALAYRDELACRQNVVSQWKICRLEHPVGKVDN